jgi:hypothetical protein
MNGLLNSQSIIIVSGIYSDIMTYSALIFIFVTIIILLNGSRSICLYIIFLGLLYLYQTRWRKPKKLLTTYKRTDMASPASCMNVHCSQGEANECPTCRPLAVMVQKSLDDSKVQEDGDLRATRQMLNMGKHAEESKLIQANMNNKNIRRFFDHELGTSRQTEWWGDDDFEIMQAGHVPI